MMSFTNLLLVMACRDAFGPAGEDGHPTPAAGIRAANRCFGDVPRLHPVSVDGPALPLGWYGGDRMFEAPLFVGAYHGLDVARFVYHLRAIDWHDPECVQLFVADDQDERRRLINVMDDDAFRGLDGDGIELPERDDPASQA